MPDGPVQPPEPGLSAEDEAAVLDTARQVLGRVMQSEQLARQQAGESAEVTRRLADLRRELATRIQRAYRSRRRPPPPAAAPPAATHTDTDRWRDAAPFRHVLAPAGAVSGALGKGPEVELLQQVLQHEGHTVALSGVYDRYTAAAVRQFQERHGIRPANGIVGGETRRALNNITGKVS